LNISGRPLSSSVLRSNCQHRTVLLLAAAGAVGAADGLFKSVLYVQQLSAQLDQQVPDPTTLSWVKTSLMPQFVTMWRQLQERQLLRCLLCTYCR
jgi:hypothetical protein